MRMASHCAALITSLRLERLFITILDSYLQGFFEGALDTDKLRFAMISTDKKVKSNQIMT